VLALETKTDLQEVGCGYMDWIGLAQDRDRWQMLVCAVMKVSPVEAMSAGVASLINHATRWK